MNNFSNLGLGAKLLKVLAAESYSEPTPIQAQAIPHILKGRDLLGIAQTGTGKTAAFALPLIELVTTAPEPLRAKRARVLVLSPTRELAAQIAESFTTYSRLSKLRVTCAVGGVPIGRQKRALANGVDVLVATPGRLLDLVDQKALDLTHVEFLVLDEADQMLDLGFIHALRRIVQLVPHERQTLFFSATMPKTIAALAASFLSDPVRVAVTPVAKTADRVKQAIVFAEKAEKSSLLRKVLEDSTIARALVFTRTKHGADKLCRDLERAGIDARAIHGNKSQGQREKALGQFREGRMRILVATDIAARGIDVDGVTHVINYDLPNVPETYVHRIGRTARAGAEGSALSLCSSEERAYLRDIERLTRQKIEVLDRDMQPATAEPADVIDLPTKARKPAAAVASPQKAQKQANGKKQNKWRKRKPKNGQQAEGKNRGPHQSGRRSNGGFSGRGRQAARAS